MWYETLTSHTWTSFIASSLAFLLFQIIKKYQRAKSVADKRKREMSASELFYHNTFLRAKSLVSFVTILESKVSMDEAFVQRALEMLARRHPSLRMTIEEVKDGEETRFFYKEMESFRVDLRESDLTAKSEDNWQLAFSHELLQPMNCEVGPLWRVCQLKECVLENGNVINCLIWTFHHSIIDGHSVGIIVDEFLVFLHKQCIDDSLDTEVEEERYDMVPSCETGMEDELQLNCIDRLKLEFDVRLRAGSRASVNEDVVQKFFAKFPLTAQKGSNLESKTKAVFITFDENETGKLLRACKRRGCTVQGILSAAASMAIVELLQDGEVENEWAVPSSFVVNMRKHCQHLSKISDIGLFVGLVPMHCTIPVFNDSNVEETLWNAAQECTSCIKNRLANKCHINDFKKLHNISSPSLICGFYEADVLQDCAGRYKGSYFSISNMGRYESTLSHDSTYKICRMFFGYGEHIKGPLFVNNFVSVNGQLCWTAIYFTSVTETHIADEYRSRMLAKLHLAMQSL